MRKLLAIALLVMVSCANVSGPFVSNKSQDFEQVHFMVSCVSETAYIDMPVPNRDHRPKIKVLYIYTEDGIVKSRPYYFVVPQSVYDKYQYSNVFIEFPIYLISQFATCEYGYPEE